MGNMSYCRFQNTLSDLRDCYVNMEDEDLSAEEKQAKAELLSLCTRISGEYSLGFNQDLENTYQLKTDYDDNALPDDQFEAYCKFEEACEESEYQPMAFHEVKNGLKAMGYDGVELYETLARIVTAPVIKQCIENGTIVGREDLEAVLNLPGKTVQVCKIL
jgi:hypothetical protein